MLPIVANKFVDEAVVAKIVEPKKLVVVALVDVEFEAVKF